MISKELFCEKINRIKEAEQCERDIFDAAQPYVRKGTLFDYVTVGTGFLAQDVLDLLSVLMGLGEDDILSYWCWECDFGKEPRTIRDPAYREDEFVITTVDELYDYCCHISRQNSEEV